MRHTEPKVFLLAKTNLEFRGVYDFLRAVGVEEAKDKAVEFTNHEPGEGLIELAGRTCYKSFEPRLNPNVTRVRADHEKYLGNILKSGHGSVLEHASVTFGFVNVSRVFTHEIVRHRAGMAFSQESLRFVRFEDIPFWIPPSLADPQSREIVNALIGVVEASYIKLVENYGIEDMKSFADKKAITSALRRIIPDGVSTNIVVTGNHRAWRHIIEQRCSGHAEEEIAYIISEIAFQLKTVFPGLYQDMKKGISPNVWEFEHSKV